MSIKIFTQNNSVNRLLLICYRRTRSKKDIRRLETQKEQRPSKFSVKTMSVSYVPVIYHPHPGDCRTRIDHIPHVWGGGALKKVKIPKVGNNLKEICVACLYMTRIPHPQRVKKFTKLTLVKSPVEWKVGNVS